MQGYLMVLLATAMTVGDTNRAKSEWHLVPAEAGRIRAIMWLDSTNLLYNLYRRVSRN